MLKTFLVTLLISGLVVVLNNLTSPNNPDKDLQVKVQASTKSKTGKKMKEKISKSDEEWKKELTDDEYYILRQKGTERAFTGKYYKYTEEGIYLCAGCGNELFASDTKYESGSGWPSYWAPLNNENVELKEDNSYGMVRIEVVCSKCGGHLGHVFDDGPDPTGKRFCINSAALDFKKKTEK